MLTVPSASITLSPTDNSVSIGSYVLVNSSAASGFSLSTKR